MRRIFHEVCRNFVSFSIKVRISYRSDIQTGSFPLDFFSFIRFKNPNEFFFLILLEYKSFGNTFIPARNLRRFTDTFIFQKECFHKDKYLT